MSIPVRARDVDLLRIVRVEHDTTLCFNNGTTLNVEPGIYYPVAFGVALDCHRHKLIGTPERLAQMRAPRWPHRELPNVA